MQDSPVTRESPLFEWSTLSFPQAEIVDAYAGELCERLLNITMSSPEHVNFRSDTGNKVDFKAFQIYRIADGKLAEHWEVADFAKFQEQLGAKSGSSAFKQFQGTLK